MKISARKRLELTVQIAAGLLASGDFTRLHIAENMGPGDAPEGVLQTDRGAEIIADTANEIVNAILKNL